MSAIALYAKASPDFADKLAQSLHLLQTAELEHGSLVQASSLGAEDMVVTHLPVSYTHLAHRHEYNSRPLPPCDRVGLRGCRHRGMGPISGFRLESPANPRQCWRISLSA